jgi:hypothetical protein
MRPALTTVAACMLLAACADQPLPTDPDLRPQLAVTPTENVKLTLLKAEYNPCADDGAGETVVLSGELHEVARIKVEKDGGWRMDVHMNPQGVKGVGMTTGTEYRASGVTRSTHKVEAGETIEVKSRFRMISQGSSPDFHYELTTLVSVDANGTLLAVVAEDSYTCR